MQKFLLSSALIFSFAGSAIAAQSLETTQLNHERLAAVKRYINDLQQADYKDIVQLFDKNAIVVSTGRGKIDAKEFFYAFLPNIESATTVINQTFVNTAGDQRLAARFHFTFKMKDGEENSGEYIDEFVFANNSSKLAAVYMFENLHFPNE